MAAITAGLCLAAAQTAYADTPAIGDLAPSFSGTTLDGKKITLGDFKGDVVIVNLWATWCAPCRQEMPVLDNYAEKRRDAGLRVVGITLDADNKAIAKWVPKIQEVLHYPLIQDFKGPYTMIHRAVPTSYIIDRSGHIRYAKAGQFKLDDLNTLLVPLLNEPAPEAGKDAPTQPTKISD